MSKNKIKDKIKIEYVSIPSLRPATYNPRKWDEKLMNNLKQSIINFGVVDPLIVNNAPNRKKILINGHFRLAALKELGHKNAPVIFVNIPDVNREKELNLRLNKNTGAFDFEMLANFDESFLADIGFESKELDEIFDIENNLEEVDLVKELKKMGSEKFDILMEKCPIYSEIISNRWRKLTRKKKNYENK